MAITKLIADSITSGAIANTPAFAAYHNTSQSIPHATLTKILFNTEITDTDSAFSSNRFTVPSGKGGTYFITASVRYTDHASGQYIYVYKNNSSAIGGVMHLGAGSYNDDITCSFVANLSATDYIEVFGIQYSGGALNIEGLSDSWYRTHFAAYKIIT